MPEQDAELKEKKGKVPPESSDVDKSPPPAKKKRGRPRKAAVKAKKPDLFIILGEEAWTEAGGPAIVIQGVENLPAAISRMDEAQQGGAMVVHRLGSRVEVTTEVKVKETRASEEKE